MGACMSSVPEPAKPVVERPIEERGIPAQPDMPAKPVEPAQKPVQKPVEPAKKPAKKFCWRRFGFKTLAMTVEVACGLITVPLGVTIFLGSVGLTTVLTAIWVPVYLVPATIINTLVCGPFSAVINYAESYWQQIVVEGIQGSYEMWFEHYIGDTLKNLRDIWRMSVYR